MVEAGLQGPGDVVGQGVGAERDQRQLAELGLGAQAAAEVQARAVGQVDVHQGHVGAGVFDGGHAFGGVFGREQTHLRVGREDGLDQAAVEGVVFDVHHAQR